MQINVNGNGKQITDHTNIATLLEMVGVNPQQVVTEHNGQIIPPEDYGETYLNNGDTIELIHFVGGG